ncbi:hypothetical protein R5R35_009186 [Gryllus longicercus]|uniref:Uncharacterized protein n=1 Tax=Gryllus longicercus TaxID=2509291 RepID=A0AAN9VJK0_9ORTH
MKSSNTLVEPEIESETRGHVRVYWFPRDFSQSRFGDRATGSNACTLIALLMAQRCYQQEIKICTPDNQISKATVNALAESILEGNALHEALLARGALRHVNMTVPEAIAAAGARAKFVCEWRSLVYLMDLGASLFEQLAETLADWERNPPPRRHGHDLYVVLIADNRSVLLVFQKDQDRVSLIDSHQHQAHGAVVVQVQTAYLQQLCAWYNSLLQSCYGARPECYELSYLYFKCFEAGEMPSG